MDTLFVTDSEKTSDFIKSALGAAGNKIGLANFGKFGLVGWIDIIYEMQSVARNPTVAVSEGSMLGVGGNNTKFPEILMRFDGISAMLPLSAFYVLNDIVLATGEDLNHWRVLTPNGETLPLMPRLVKLFETDKDSSVFDPFVELQKIIEYKPTPASYSSMISWRAAAYKNAMKNAHHSSSWEVLRHTFQKLRSALIASASSGKEIYAAQVFSGLGWGSRPVVVEVWPNSKTYGTLAGNCPEGFRIRELEIFDQHAERTISELITALGGRNDDEVRKSFDEHGGNARIYLNHQGMTISIQTLR